MAARQFRPFLLLFLAFIASADQAAAQATNIWITGPLQKVQQTNTTPGNAQSLQIYASRNEFADFQVHALPTTNSIQMSVAVSDFVNAQANYTISAASNVFLYREAYVNITTLSDQNGTLGITPDPLIPTVDPYSKQARNAFPFTVAANQTQSAWIDVLVPPGAPPGDYSGTVTISDGSNQIGQLSVTLTVWAFTLPSTASLKSAFGVSTAPNGLCVQAYGDGYNSCAQYPGSGGSSDTAIEMILHNEALLALDHRLSLSGVVYVGPPSFGGGDWTHFDATYGDLLNGTAATILGGAALTALQYRPPANVHTDPSVIQNWVTHFTANNWLGDLFDYTCDEPPNGCTWAFAQSEEQTIHAGSPNMKTLITTNIANAMQNNVLSDLNIIVPIVNDMEPQNGTNQRSTYNSFLNSPNTHLWWYQSCESHGSCSNGVTGPTASTWPSYMIDAGPVRNRVFQWLAYIDSIEAELYYATDYCWYTTCASSNPWVSSYAFGGNGDGTLIYPGTTAMIGGTTPVPVPSMRLKLIRDGMQDFEYLHALSQAGQDAFARATAASFITNAYTFNTDPQALLSARVTLGNQLGQAYTTSTSVTSSVNPSAYGQSVMFTATVSAAAGTPTGTVTFYDAATALGQGTLAGGSATFSTTSLSVGSHSITAVYGGDSTFPSSTSSILTQNVQQVSYGLTVASSGQGAVASSPSGINCGATCTANFTSGTQVTLSETPASGWGFAGWSGACSGLGSCVVTMTGGQSVTATFVKSTYTLAVAVSGGGKVTSTPAGSPGAINCGSTCAATYASGTLVTLTATPSGGATFIGWGGACSGSGGCAVTMGGSTSVTATFSGSAARLTRTFVSSAGNDGNPCTIAQPCATFAHAYSLTAANGIIAALDPGKYGPLTITGAITINGNGWAAITAPAAGNGVTVTAGAGDKVTLTGLEIDGAGAGYNGIVLISAGGLAVANCVLENFVNNGGDPTTGNGLFITPTSGTVDFAVTKTTASNNGFSGIYYYTPSGSPDANGVIDDVVATDNQYGIAVDTVPAGGGTTVATISNSIASDNAVSGIAAFNSSAAVKLSVDNVSVSGNASGIDATGTVNVLLGRSVITGNGTGISNGTSPSTLFTYKDNRINLNGTDIGGSNLNQTTATLQ